MLELEGTRIISGATRLLVRRRASRPASQSSQLMGRPLGIIGTFCSEFSCDIRGEFPHRRKNTIFRPPGKLLHFVPVHLAHPVAVQTRSAKESLLAMRFGALNHAFTI